MNTMLETLANLSVVISSVAIFAFVALRHRRRRPK